VEVVPRSTAGHAFANRVFEVVEILARETVARSFNFACSICSDPPARPVAAAVGLSLEGLKRYIAVSPITECVPNPTKEPSPSPDLPRGMRLKNIDKLLEASAVHAKVVHNLHVFFGEGPLEERSKPSKVSIDESLDPAPT
jgi:hypothetical protein